MALSFLMARVVYVAKIQKIEKLPKYRSPSLERPPKSNIFLKKFTHQIFWVLEHFYVLGAQLFKKNF